MRKFVGFGLALVTGLVSTAALAQEASTSVEVSSGGNQLGLGADLGVLIPVGNLSDASSVMIGGVIKGEYPVTPGVEVTGRIGYFHGLSKEPTPGASASLSDIPIWVGARYFFGGARDGVYAGGEIGLNILKTTIEMPTIQTPLGPVGGELSDSSTEFGLNLIAGYKLGDIDFRGNLHFLDIGDPGDSMAVGLTVGYTFAKF